MTETTTTPRQLSRRTLAKGAAWAAPAVLAASGAPAFAASGPQCVANVPMTANPTSGTQTLTATAEGGSCTMTLTITNGLTGCAPDRNMTIGRTGNMVAGQNSCGYSTYTIPTTGLIVQNAPCACRTGGGSVLARYAYVPDGTRASSQDVTFSFSQPVQNLKITVADISSARPNGGWVPGYVGNYYDHVGFSITPTEISHAAARDKGTGAGTFAAPFRRNDTNAQSSSGPYSEVFSFGPTTSLRTLTMRYNNGPTSNNIKGTQAIFIPTITFDMPCNC